MVLLLDSSVMCHALIDSSAINTSTALENTTGTSALIICVGGLIVCVGGLIVCVGVSLCVWGVSLCVWGVSLCEWGSHCVSGGTILTLTSSSILMIFLILARGNSGVFQ